MGCMVGFTGDAFAGTFFVVETAKRISKSITVSESLGGTIPFAMLLRPPLDVPTAPLATYTARGVCH